MFTEALIAGFTEALAGTLLTAGGRRLRRVLAEPERQQALRRCCEAGIVALIRAAQNDCDEEALAHLSELMHSFLTSEELNDDLSRTLAPLLQGHELDMEEMRELFVDAGYDPETLPCFDFDAAFTAFAGGFSAAAVEQPALRGEIRTHLLFAQLELQTEMRDALRELVTFLGQAKSGTATVSAGQITAENVAGTQIFLNAPNLDTARQEAAGWEAHYLNTVISQCDPLDLSPIDETHPQGSRPGDAGSVRLSEVFIGLLLEGVERLPSEDVAQALDGRGRHQERLAKSEQDEKPVPVTALEATAALPRLVVLGRPGGGKSTLVNHLTTQLAKRRLDPQDGDGKLPGWTPEQRPLPVRIVLRRFASWLPDDAKPSASLVWNYLRHQLEEHDGCLGAFDGLREMLTRDGGIVFFDGLDEVHEDDATQHRSLIRDSIRDFARPLHDCRVVVTCREYAYRHDDAWRLPEADFPAVTLAPFGAEQISAFTATWYRVIGPDKGWSAQRCEREAQQLASAVMRWPHLLTLAESPLLLTLMAQIHGRDGYLPRDRADLYERTVNLLLAHWENRLVRDLRAGSTVEADRVLRLGVRLDTLRGALEKVAFEAHERQERQDSRGQRAADVPVGDLLLALEEYLGDLAQARRVITYLQQRAGLLQAVDAKTYRFPHRTFQEYLAARHLLKQPEYDEMLRDRVHRDSTWWREVFLLAAGASRETPRLISDLVDRLVSRPVGDTAIQPEEAERARIAAQALEETRFVERVEKERATEPGRFTETYTRIQDWLLAGLRADASLEPTLRADCGDSLAGLGDPRPEVMTLEGMEFCRVPAGPFWMGSDDHHGDEKPCHLNSHLDYGYWIARYPVTTAQYRQYVDASGHKPGDPGALHGAANVPVVGVSWREANRFCTWLSRHWAEAAILPTGWGVHLPSEAEWEKAVRGGLEILEEPEIKGRDRALATVTPAVTARPNPHPKRDYPWKGGFDENRCNSWESGIHRVNTTGCFPNGISPYGVAEMSGNVREWTRSRIRTYPYDPSDGRERKEDAAGFVLRGGGFGLVNDDARCAARRGGDPSLRYDFVGFRVVLSPSGICL